MRTFRERRESKKVENYPEARSKRRLEKGVFFKGLISQKSGKKKACRKKNLTSAERE
jgi:hypothetical protein